MKPVIAYVEDRHDNVARDALLHVLQNDLGCRVLDFSNDYEFTSHIHLVEAQFRQELLACVLIAEDRYEEDIPQCRNVVKTTREELGGGVPIAIMPFYADGSSTVADLPRADSDIHVIPRYEPELMDRISGWAHAAIQSLTQRRRKTATERELLRRSYDIHSDEETRLAGVDDNHKEVAEWLRVKLTPSLCMKTYFDDSLPKKAVQFEAVDDAEFRRSVEIVKAMNPREREDFLWTLNRRDPDSPSHGENVSGYAIDVRSLISSDSHGFGMHGYAAIRLNNILDELDRIRSRRRDAEMPDSLVLSGLIHREVEGHATPILKFYAVGIPRMTMATQEDLRRVGRHLLSLRQFVPVDCKGTVIDGEYVLPEDDD